MRSATIGHDAPIGGAGVETVADEPSTTSRLLDLLGRHLSSQESMLQSQHTERMDEAKALREAVAGSASENRKAHTDLQIQLAEIKAGGLGSWERRGLLTGGLVVLLLLILLLAESRGVDATQAIDGVKELVPVSFPDATPPSPSTTLPKDAPPDNPPEPSPTTGEGGEASSPEAPVVGAAVTPAH